ncbi:unnamed protein product [Closterium sp. NIES-54]
MEETEEREEQGESEALEEPEEQEAQEAVVALEGLEYPEPMAEEGERYRAQSSAEPAELSASRLADLSAAAAAATEGVTEDGDFPVEGAPAASPPFAAAATGGVPVERGEGSDEAIGGGIWTREFSEEGPDGTFHFQIVKLNQQVYLWVGLNTASHGNVYTAIPTRFDPMPLVTPLIGGGAEGASATMAARLSECRGGSCQKRTACTCIYIDYDYSPDAASPSACLTTAPSAECPCLLHPIPLPSCTTSPAHLVQQTLILPLQQQVQQPVSPSFVFSLLTGHCCHDRWKQPNQRVQN